jgi:hypothetical protein
MVSDFSVQVSAVKWVLGVSALAFVYGIMTVDRRISLVFSDT